MNIDLASMSSHKIYGPRGAGALFMRRKNLAGKLQPVLFGGKQEMGLRPGTENIPAIVGFGKACDLMQAHAPEIARHIGGLRDRMKALLFAAFPDVVLNGCPDHRHPGNLNLAIPQVSGERLIGDLPHIAFSTSSACTSSSAKPSHVLMAIGQDEQRALSSFRLGFGKFNTFEEVEAAARQIIRAVELM